MQENAGKADCLRPRSDFHDYTTSSVHAINIVYVSRRAKCTECASHGRPKLITRANNAKHDE